MLLRYLKTLTMFATHFKLVIYLIGVQSLKSGHHWVRLDSVALNWIVKLKNGIKPMN